jgi:hypothetical protein
MAMIWCASVFSGSEIDAVSADAAKEGIWFAYPCISLLTEKCM